MGVYASLLLLPLIWAAARASRPRHEKAARILIVVTLALFIGSRREVGGDWDAYLIMFQRAHRFDLLDALSLNDPGYMLLARLIATLGLGAGAVNVVIGTAFAGSLTLFCARQPSPPLALLVAIPVMVVIVAMGFTRQAAAASCVMMALAVWRPDRPWVPLALFVAAPLFHWSALLLVPLAPMLQTGRSRSPWLPLLIGLAAGLIVAAIILTNAELAGRVAAARVSIGAPMRMAPSWGALLLYLLLRRRMKLTPEDQAAFGFWCGLIAFSTVLLPVFPTIADRFNLYAVLFQMMVSSHTVALVRDKVARKAVAAALSVPPLLLHAGWLSLSEYRVCWLPYRTYLSEPSALLLSSVPERPTVSALCQIAQGKFRPVKAKVAQAPSRR